MVRTLVLASLLALSLLVSEVVSSPVDVEGSKKHVSKKRSTKKHTTTKKTTTKKSSTRKPTSTKTTSSAKPTKTSGGGGNAPSPGQTIDRCTVPGTIGLTFDDGVYEYEQNIATQLLNAGGKGTFFINGYNYDCAYDPEYVALVQKTYAQGHMIGSHTWNHADITKLTTAQFNQELDLIEAYTMKVLGIKPKYFRPPYGDINAANIAVLKQRGYIITLWQYDSGDANGEAPSKSEAMYDQIAKSHPNPGPIVLNHETIPTTSSEVLPHAIQVLKPAGYTFATVADCVNDPNPYQWVGEPSQRDSTWTCNGTPPPGSN